MFEDSSGSLLQLSQIGLSQSQVGQGNLPWSPPWWLQHSQLTAGITPALQGDQCPPKKASHEGCKLSLPCLALPRPPIPWGRVSAEPRACSGVRPGVMGSGLCWQLSSHFNHLATAETRAVSLQGHLAQGRVLHSCLSAGGTFRWIEYLTSHLFNIKRAHFSILQHSRNVIMASACFQAAGCQSLRARKWPELFPWIRKHIPLPAEAASFQHGAGTRGEGGEAA